MEIGPGSPSPANGPPAPGVDSGDLFPWLLSGAEHFLRDSRRAAEAGLWDVADELVYLGVRHLLLASAEGGGRWFDVRDVLSRCGIVASDEEVGEAVRDAADQPQGTDPDRHLSFLVVECDGNGGYRCLGAVRKWRRRRYA